MNQETLGVAVAAAQQSVSSVLGYQSGGALANLSSDAPAPAAPPPILDVSLQVRRHLAACVNPHVDGLEHTAFPHALPPHSTLSCAVLSCDVLRFPLTVYCMRLPPVNSK